MVLGGIQSSFMLSYAFSLNLDPNRDINSTLNQCRRRESIKLAESLIADGRCMHLCYLITGCHHALTLCTYSPHFIGPAVHHLHDADLTHFCSTRLNYDQLHQRKDKTSIALVHRTLALKDCSTACSAICELTRGHRVATVKRRTSISVLGDPPDKTPH